MVAFTDFSFDLGLFDTYAAVVLLVTKCFNQYQQEAMLLCIFEDSYCLISKSVIRLLESEPPKMVGVYATSSRTLSWW